VVRAEWLELPGTAGLEFRLEHAPLTAGPGIHVLIGANNSGKTRLLELLAGARIGARIRPSDLAPRPPIEHAAYVALWGSLGELRVSWPRLKATEPGLTISEEDLRPYLVASPGIERAVWDRLGADIRSHLPERPATLVRTHRYFEQTAALSGRPHLSNMREWPALLSDLERSEDRTRRSLYASLRDSFEFITEGLSFTLRGAAAEVTMYVSEPLKGTERTERRFDDCGDGLRDLVGILLHSKLEPNADLLVDEPGLRLHPGTQRRLLSFFEDEAKLRTVWLASHDGVFVGAPNVEGRYFVRRVPGEDKTVVEELPGRDETRRSLVQLGWAPSDALLADRVLLCEGPSDKVAFEAVRARLQEEDATWGGLEVADLGGDGSVVGNDPEVRQRIELACKIAPHAQITILLDSSGRNADEKRKLRQMAASKQARVEFLERPELENYFLEPSLVHAVLAALTERVSRQRGEILRAPSLDAVTEELAKHNPDKKGSAVLESVWALAKMQYKKPEAIRQAIDIMRQSGPASGGALSTEVKNAFAPGAAGGG
jgi:hypothetical protein